MIITFFNFKSATGERVRVWMRMRMHIKGLFFVPARLLCRMSNLYKYRRELQKKQPSDLKCWTDLPNVHSCEAHFPAFTCMLMYLVHSWGRILTAAYRNKKQLTPNVFSHPQVRIFIRLEKRNVQRMHILLTNTGPVNKISILKGRLRMWS